MTPPILIVDDSLTVRMDLDEALRGAGFETEICADGASARRALAASTYGLVILDVLLPDVDGVDLLREIKTASQEPPPVMLLSSEAEVRDRVRGLNKGADEYVGKPYDATYIVARAAELLRARAPMSRTNATVLVIDDSPTAREHVGELLRSAGVDVLFATTGEDGLRIAVASRPDAIVVDGVMPGIDGPTVVRRIRTDAALRRTPCVLLTGSGAAVEESAALEAGADMFVRKDEDGEVIVARLMALLRSTSLSLEKDPPSLLAPKKILAVDDSETYLQTLVEELRPDGYDVVLARSGSEALALLEVQTVDCILLDLEMPGLSGEVTCRKIKSQARLRDVPLVILTAREERDSMISGINAGADDYILKSGPFDVLRARVRAQIRRRQFEDENRSIRERLLRREIELSEARAANELAATRAQLLADVERKNAELAEANAELEAFSYSISHDLRAPVRYIDGFSAALQEDYGELLDEGGREHLAEIRRSAQRMGELIDDLLALSRTARAEIDREELDLGRLAYHVAAELRHQHPNRTVTLEIEPDLMVQADPRLLRVLFENLLGNCWKFTAERSDARVEVRRSPSASGAFLIRDNGVGFEQKYAGKLFCPFQRLHGDDEFEGTGIGLAIVHRIVRKHGGRAWAEGIVGEGATIHFTLGEESS